MTLNRLIFTVIIALSLAGCGHSEQSTRPLPPAYPRVERCDTTVTTEHHGDAIWTTVDYPAFNASTHYTERKCTPQQLPAIAADRFRQMTLTFGGAEATAEEFVTPAGYSVTIITAPTARTTPVQFFATDSLSVITGAVFFRAVDARAPIDSLRPMVEIMRTDIISHLCEL